MAIAFPAITPTSYSVTPAVYSVSRPKFRSAIIAPRLWGSKPSQLELTLDYTNITDVQSLSIFTAWKDSRSGYLGVTLPAAVIAGVVSTALRLRLRPTIPPEWYFAEPPKLDIVSAKSLSVTVKLRATPANATVTPFGFRGFLNPATRYTYARWRDWDEPLFGVGTVAEGPGYRVDGSYAMRALSDSQAVVYDSTGSFASYSGYTVGTVRSIDPSNSGYSPILSNTLAYGGLSFFQLLFSNTPIPP